MAAGLSLPRDNMEPFIESLQQAVITVLDGASLTTELLTDGEFEPGEMGMNLARQLQDFGPWGRGFTEPLVDGRFEVLEQRVVGRSHRPYRMSYGRLISYASLNQTPRSYICTILPKSQEVGEFLFGMTLMMALLGVCTPLKAA